jgi:hypothetical protein
MLVHKIEWINDVTYKVGSNEITKSYDLHLIPGAEIAPSLLKIYESDTSWKWASEITPADNVTVKFDWRISIGPGGGIIHAWGMAIHLDKGWLKIDDHLGPDRLYNSIVEATVIDQNTNPPILRTSAIRIHIHDSIKSAWLTPSALDVREGTDRLRFSILAEFNDKATLDFPIIGDISTHPGIEWESNDPDFVFVDPHNGHLTAHPGSSSVTIRAKLPSPFNVVIPRAATVIIQKSWSSLQAKVKPVGELTIDQSRIHKFPNILFIPDGFKDGEEVLFEELVKGIVLKIRESGTLMPFNWFTINKKINYWSVFIPSPEWGTSVLNFMTEEPRTDPVTHESQIIGKINESYPPYAVKPDIESPDKWNLQELIYVVGLPILLDRNLPDNAQYYNDKLANWINRFNRDDIIRPRSGETEIDTWKRKVNIELLKEWKKIGNYLLADERDTALGIAKGNRPFVLDVLNEVRTLSMHPFRTNRDHLDKFLMNLQADGIPTPIGNVWGPTDPVDQDKGKDRTHVVVLCRGGPRAGAFNLANDLIAISMTDTSEVKLKQRTAASLEFEIVPHGLPALRKLSLMLINTIIHELSHSLQLLDEYGGMDSMPDSFNDFLKLVPNLQPRSELLSSFTGPIASSNIKWKWYRIEKAGVLIEKPNQPNPAVQKFDIRLEPGQAGQFHFGDHVFLRQRPLLKNPASITSPELIVDPEPVGDIVKVKVDGAGGHMNVDDFPGGTVNSSHDSILFRPRRDTVSHELELIVHKKILHQIDISGGPLNAPSGNAMRDCVSDARSRVPRLNPNEIQTPRFPPNFLSNFILNWELIIGLYEGGNGYHCNVYHPAGICLMRRLNDVTPLCHICRYILVDIIDPSSHSKIDEMYDHPYSEI